MTSYLVRRFLLMILTLFGISVIIFVLLRIVPGNIVDILADAAGFVNPAEKKLLEAEFGLDGEVLAHGNSECCGVQGRFPSESTFCAGNIRGRNHSKIIAAHSENLRSGSFPADTTYALPDDRLPRRRLSGDLVYPTSRHPRRH